MGCGVRKAKLGLCAAHGLGERAAPRYDDDRPTRARDDLQDVPQPARLGEADWPRLRQTMLDRIADLRAEEKGVTQKVRLSIAAYLSPDVRSVRDEAEEVVSYTGIIDAVNEIASAGHINLVETLCEKIAAACLRDKRVVAARVRVEKPDIIKNARSVGVEIERQR